MFYIVERETQLPSLPSFNKCFVHVIPNNDNYHPAISDVSLVYVKPFEGKGYIFCIKHNESLGLKWQTVKKFLSEKELYAVDAKYTKYFFGGKINDITFNYISQGGSKFNFDKHKPNVMSDFYSNFGIVKNVNELIPISKHYEYCEKIFDEIKPYLTKNTDYMIKRTDVFYKIEREGIKLDKGSFIRYHGDHTTPQFSIKRGIIYTHYNLYTATGRPSNAFNGINYAALNKENGERMCYIPKNDIFIEFDFNGYHPRLLGTLVNYKFDDTNVYQQIGDIIGESNISKVKEIVFQNIYGGIRQGLKDKPFFNKVQDFTNLIWDNLQHDGSFETPSGKVFYLKDIENPTPQKALNYFIQNYETFQNVEQLHSIFNDFRPLKSRIVLYTYDSILIDADQEEINKIKQIITKLQYPVRTKTGSDYNELE